MMAENECSNWDRFLEEVPLGYRNAAIKGKVFDDINSIKGGIYSFPVREGCDIRHDGIVLIDGYCEAFPIEGLREEEEPELCEVVGRAVACLRTDGGHPQKVVLVRRQSIVCMHNTEDAGHRITEDDISAPCYLEDDLTVSLSDGMSAFAGQIAGVEHGDVYVFVNLGWGDEA